MAIRWRRDGRLLCAAMTEAEPGDTYIDDRLHYQLSVISRAILASPGHDRDALWYWVHPDVGAPWLRAQPDGLINPGP